VLGGGGGWCVCFARRYTNVAMMRQQMKPSWRVHGVVVSPPEHKYGYRRDPGLTEIYLPQVTCLRTSWDP
jgi:hypothetical protein